MPNPDWWTLWKRFGAIPLILVVAALLILFNAGAWDWLGNQENATAVEGFFAIVQGISTFALILLTFFTVRANNVMAQETKRMAEVADVQLLATIQPTIVVRLCSVRYDDELADADQFRVEIENIGLGPALHVFVFFKGLLNYQVADYPAQPAIVPAKERMTFTFFLEEETPFSDLSDPQRFQPDTEFEMELEERLGPHSASGNFATLLREAQEKRKADRHAFLESSARRIGKLDEVGVVSVEYQDLRRLSYVASAEIIAEERPWTSPPSVVWPALRILRIEFAFRGAEMIQAERRAVV